MARRRSIAPTLDIIWAPLAADGIGKRTLRALTPRHRQQGQALSGPVDHPSSRPVACPTAWPNAPAAALDIQEARNHARRAQERRDDGKYGDQERLSDAKRMV